MLFFSRERAELVLISILMLPVSPPSPGEWLPRQIRHQVSEIKHVILFFHVRELSEKEPSLLGHSAHFVQFLSALKASNLRAGWPTGSQEWHSYSFLLLTASGGGGGAGRSGAEVMILFSKGPVADHLPTVFLRIYRTKTWRAEKEKVAEEELAKQTLADSFSWTTVS